MARIRKPTTTEPHSGPEGGPETGDDLRRFIDYAADMIAAQEAVRSSLTDAAAALEKAATSYDRTVLAIARRERDGIAVRLESDIDVALRRVRTALTEPVLRAETIAGQVRITAALAGIAGGVMGAGGMIALFIFRII
jgi:hypothetical protein